MKRLEAGVSGQLTASFLQILRHNFEDVQFCVKVFSCTLLGLQGKLDSPTPFPGVFWFQLLEKRSRKYCALVNGVTFHQGRATGQPGAPWWKMQVMYEKLVFVPSPDESSISRIAGTAAASLCFLCLVHGTKLGSGDGTLAAHVN